MKEEAYSFKYGVGKIGEVLVGDVEKVDSLEDLRGFGKEAILVPKLIGVYQCMIKDREGGRIYDFMNEQVQSVVFLERGAVDEVASDLICVGYDPTIIPLGVLRRTLEGDVLGRLNVLRYIELDAIDFYGKPQVVQNLGNTLRNAQMNASPMNISKVETASESAKFACEDYGLTRVEAFGGLAVNRFLVEAGKKSDIISDGISLSVGKRLLDERTNEL